MFEPSIQINSDKYVQTLTSPKDGKKPVWTSGIKNTVPRKLKKTHMGEPNSLTSLISFPINYYILFYI